MSSTQDAILSQDLDPESKLIFAFLGSRNIGDFTEQVVTAAAVKENGSSTFQVDSCCC